MIIYVGFFYWFMLGVSIFVFGLPIVWDSGIAAILFLIVLLFFTLIFPLGYMIIHFKDFLKSAKTFRTRIKEILGFREPDEDNDEISSLTTSFKSYIKDFYQGKKFADSDAHEGNKTMLQTIVNQNLHDSLTVHKDRLAKNGVSLDFEVARKKYGDSPSVNFSEHSNGSYKTYAVYEEIHSTRTYKSDGIELKKIINREIAHYSIIDDQNIEEIKKVNCPNCNAKTTISGMIDDCDYCGASFRVADLKNRFTSFNFRKDYKTKFKHFDATEARLIFFFIISFLINVFLLAIYIIFYLINESKADGDNMIQASLLIFWVISISLAFVFISAFISAAVSYFIYRFIIEKTRGILFSKQSIIRRQCRDNKMEGKIRANDKNFSLALFLSEAQTKINIYYMTDKLRYVDGITDFDAGQDFKIDEKIIDVLIDDLDIINYAIKGKDKFINLRVIATLLRKEGNSIKQEKILPIFKFRKKLDYIKSDTFFEIKCEACASSISTLDGKICPYCGNHTDISKYEWLISEVK